MTAWTSRRGATVIAAISLADMARLEATERRRGHRRLPGGQIEGVRTSVTIRELAPGGKLGCAPIRG